jgi:transcriptional regulator NrdR family protein
MAEVAQVEGTTFVKCPLCTHNSTVKDSRPHQDGGIWRRRECPVCLTRWTTIEVTCDTVPLPRGNPGKPRQARLPATTKPRQVARQQLVPTIPLVPTQLRPQRANQRALSARERSEDRRMQQAYDLD